MPVALLGRVQEFAGEWRPAGKGSGDERDRDRVDRTVAVSVSVTVTQVNEDGSDPGREDTAGDILGRARRVLPAAAPPDGEDAGAHPGAQ